MDTMHTVYKKHNWSSIFLFLAKITLCVYGNLFDRITHLTIKCDSCLPSALWAITPTFLPVCCHGASGTAPLYKALPLSPEPERQRDHNLLLHHSQRGGKVQP